MASVVHGLDYPHQPSNPILPDIGCLSCHDLHGSLGSLLKTSTSNPDMAGDDTEANNLCWSCHTGPGLAPYRVPHSSDQISVQHGVWNVECKDCHNVHYQAQRQTYESESFLATGTLTSVTSSANSTLTDSSAAWTVDEHAGRVVFPDVDVRDRRGVPIGNLSYRILSNTATTLTLDGEINTGYIAAGDTYGIIYGKIIRNEIKVPGTSTWKEVKFFGQTGTNSFADSDATLDGVCQVCHTKTGHFRNDGSAPDQMHMNGDRGDPTGTAGENCTDKCHKHIGGFGHGKGYTKVDLCIECHGHEEGTFYMVDGMYPYNPGNAARLSTVASRGFGSTAAHSTHTESWITSGADWGATPSPMGDDDKRGPGIYCSVCHNLDNMPTFRSGTDADADGLFSLAETDVCNDCHSPYGTYNGVDSVNDSVGAKDNWNSGGVYTSDNKLKPGKEKWCAGCHDEDPSVIDYSGYATDPDVVNLAGDTASGRTVESKTSGWLYSAPRVIGNETGAYTGVTVTPEADPTVTLPSFDAGNYTDGWGFYVTGHGAPADESLPGSGGVKIGPGVNCPDCHVTDAAHIDGLHRTFSCPPSSAGDACSADWQAGYRLIYDITLPRSSSQVTGQFDLCFSCHTNIDPWDLAGTGQETNFKSGTYNLHNYHLEVAGGGRYWWPDWENATATNANFSCILCHNPHGTRQLSMIRTGELALYADKTPRRPIRMWYKDNTDPDWYWSSPGLSLSSKPSITNTTLVESTNIVMWSDDPITSGANYCSAHCHGTGQDMSTSRTPGSLPSGETGPTAPELKWAGISRFEADGVSPDAGEAGDEFLFKVKYTDVNDDGPPAVIEVWVDLDDDDVYEAGEKIALTQEYADLNSRVPYYFGVDYAATVIINKAAGSDGELKYKFYATHGADTATGAPTYDSTFDILNKAPVLEWTGLTDYEADGVNPDYGPKDGSYTFRVKYTDEDGDTCPTGGTSNIQVWIDLDDDANYEAGEKFNLNALDGDADCTDGKIYTLDYNLPNITGSDLVYNYKFYAYDGIDDATGVPVSTGSSVTVAGTVNNPPFFAWNSGTCRPEGANPPRSALTSTVNFSVLYFDEDNQCPTSGTSAIQVHVDLDNSGGYAGGELINLDEETPGDTDCTVAGGGKVYEATVTPTTAADGITYEFYATDGTDDALGAPATTGSTIDVLSATAVVKQDDTEDYTTISAAVTGTSGGATILVYDGTYNEAVAAPQWQGRGYYSACGAVETIISDANDPVVHFNHGSTSVLDGFTVTGSSGRGINSNGTNFNGLQSQPTITNSIIRNNAGRGISGYASNITITDSEIYDNSGGGVLSYSTAITNTTIRDNTVSGNGGGIASHATGGSFTLTNVVIKDNTATGSGGGIYCDVNSSYAPSWEKVTLSGNSAVSGGGAYFTLCSPTFTNALISDNSASGNGGGLHLSSWTGVKLLSSTIVNNTATGDGGAAHSPTDVPQFANSIVWGNRAGGSGHIGSFTRSSGGHAYVNFYDSIVENNGDSNITDDNYFVTGVTAHITDTGTNYDDDPNFINSAANGDYHLQLPSVAIDNAADSSGFGIPTDDLDGNARPSGSEDIGVYEYSGDDGDNPPVLSWVGSGDYVSDGVDPDSGAGGDSFEFQVDYFHADNVAPSPIELWVDENGNDAYELSEKYVMALLGGGGTFDNGNYVDGERYTKTVVLSKPGGGDVNYRFYASDGKDLATTAPTVTSTVYVGNSVPTLEYLGSGNYVDDGVDPDSANTGSTFTFKVVYKDQDNSAPDVAQVWIDENDNQAYEASEKYNVTKEGAGTDYVNGETYSYAKALSHASDGRFYYRFYFTDGKDTATGEPTDTSTAKERYSRYVLVTLDGTTTGSATAVAASSTSIDVSMPYTGDNNGDNTYTVDYCVASSCSWTNWVTGAAHSASPYSTTITGLTEGETYDVRVTYNDADGVSGTSPQTISGVTTLIYSTAVGSATAVAASSTSIDVSMPYTSDVNENNTYTVDYCVASSCSWTNWVTGAAHSASPYDTTITGLTEGVAYDVRVTYIDGDGVSGTNPQTISSVTTPIYSTTTGTATAVAASSSSINVSMPYTNDINGNNTYTVDYCVTSSCSWSNWVTADTHAASPYTTTITGLTASETYDVRMTYNDANGVNGTNPRTVTSITLPATNTPPNTPTNSTPADTATGISITPTLTASAFSDPDAGDTHAGSQWLVDDNSDCGTPLYDSGDIGDLTSHTLGSSLNYETTYYWCVRYKDNHGDWSSYSSTSSFTTEAESLPAGAVAHWKLDENTGTTANDSVGSNTGYLQADASWVTGISGSGVYFDNANDRIVANTNELVGLLDGHSAHTVEAWFKWGGGTDRDLIYAEGAGSNGYQLSIISNDGRNELNYAIRSSSALDELTYSTTLIPVNEWVHVAGTYDGTAGEMRLYVNGVEVASQTTGVPASIGDATYGWRIGGVNVANDIQKDSAATAAMSFSGGIDEVVVYDRALNASEIWTRYDSNGSAQIQAADANDRSLDGAGIQYGDQVVITFDAATNGASITSANINTVLGLSAGSWLDGSGATGNAVWTSTINTNDTLTVTLSDTTSAPTVAAGATITLGGSVIKDSQGKTISDSVVIGGDFDQIAAPKHAVAHWRMDENAGTDVSDSIGNYEGVFVDAPTWTTAKAGASALSFDGSNDRVDPATGADNLLGNHTAHTVEAWVYRTSDANQQSIIFTYGGADGIELNVVAGGLSKTAYVVKSGGTTYKIELAENTIPVGSWVHVVATYDGSAATEMHLYVNGALVGSNASGPSSIGYSATTWSIGGRNGGSLYNSGTPNHFLGYIDEVIVYDRALSHAEVLERYGEFGDKVVSVCSSGCDFTGIGSAIGDAGTVDGYTVLVHSDNSPYSENIDYGAKNIIVRAKGGPTVTTIQGTGANAPVVNFNSTSLAGPVLDGFTINNQNDAGANHGNGGIKIQGSSMPTIKNAIIEGNDLTAWSADGAGIYINGAGANIEGCTIGTSGTPNLARIGAGIYATTSTMDVTIADTTIAYGAVANDGGGIYFTAMTGTNTINSTRVNNNTVTNNYGGGISMVSMAAANTVISHSTISNNTSSKGAGIYSNGSPFTMIDTTVSNNTAANEGGGVRLNGDGADATVVGGVVNSNTAANGGGFYLENGADLTYSSGYINGNIVTGAGQGGGINAFHTGSVLDLSKMYIQGNKTVQHGGGIRIVAGSSATVTNSIITGNAAGSSNWEDGGGIYNAGTADIINSTIAGNYAGQGGGVHDAGTTTIKNSILWDNTAGDGASHEVYGSPTVTYSDVEGGHAGTGNINSDPLFIDSQQASAGTPTPMGSLGNFHIQAGSGAIDPATLDNPPADDIDDALRDANPDMGADEY